MGQQIPSKEVYHGRNMSTENDKFVRCSRCGFVCEIGRDQQAPDGSKIGWGITNTAQETCVIEYDDPNISYGSGPESIVYHNVLGSFSVLGDIGGTEYRLAQSFILGGGTPVDSVFLRFLSNVGSPSGQVTAKIETMSGGVPSGTLAHANLTKAFTPVEDTWQKVTFDNPGKISAGTYWLRLDCSNQANSNYWKWSQQNIVNPTGMSGATQTNGGSWTLANGAYFNFKIGTIGSLIPRDWNNNPSSPGLVITPDFIRSYDDSEEYDAELYYDSYDSGKKDGSLSYDSVKLIYDPIVHTGCPQCGTLRYNK